MSDNVTQNRFADLSSFLLAYNSFLSGALYDTPEEAKSITDHEAVGRRIITRFKDQIFNGINQYLVVIEAERVRGVKAQIRRYKNLVNSPTDVLNKTPEVLQFLVLMFKWLNSRPAILNSLFDARARSVISTLASQVDSGEKDGFEFHASNVHEFAKLPALSGLRVTRSWIQEAANIFGVRLSSFESMQSDVETAQAIGSEIGKAQREVRLSDPKSSDSKKAKAKVKRLEAAVEKIAQSSQNPGAVILASAQAASSEVYKQSTQIGKQLGLSRDQEKALLVDGLSIIAAGAGSGKTRVLAGKVVHHVRDEGIPIRNVIATSFSSKSAKELKERIKAYGVDPGNLKNIGTVHSLGRSILDTFDPSFRSDNVLSNAETTRLIRIAMAQVKMLGGGGATPPSQNDPFFPAPSGAQVDSGDQDFKRNLGYAIGYWDWMANNNYSVRRSLALTRRVVGTRASQVLNYLKSFEQRSVSSLTQREKDVLNDIFSGSKRYRDPIDFRVAKQMFEDEEFLREFRRQLKQASLNSGSLKEAARARGRSKWFETPAKQWFNLGWPLVVGDSQKAQKIGPKRFSTAISKFIGKMESVGQCYDRYIANQVFNNGFGYASPGELSRGEEPPPFMALATAVYGAYNWLKANSVEFANKVTYDDMLIGPVSMMKHNPSVLNSLKSKYSHILVDEAQDLNALQHTLFGLIAGYLNPKTLKPYRDKRVNAEVFTLIGDDKQAIYAFRGADPEEFIRRSDLGEDKGDFNTVVLETNYRSGGMIVGAANNLIKHNVIRDEDTGIETYLQIPMICNVLASSENEGVIEAIPVETPRDAAEDAAETIKSLLDSGFTLGSSADKPTFGIALRTNAEAYNYCVALIKRGIPFRSKANVFGNYTTKALVNYLKLATSNDVGDINEAVKTLYTSPDFKLGKVFVSRLATKASGNYYDYLLNNWSNFFSSDWKNRQLGKYVENLRMVREVYSTYEPAAFLDSIFSLEGIDEDFNVTTFRQALIEQIRQNEDEMDMLSEESTNDTGAVDESAIEAKAMAPVEMIREVLNVFGDLKNAAAYIKKLQKMSGRTEKSDEGVEPAVFIGTAHSWKGLECEILFTQMAEGMFPSIYSLNDDYALAQERRLAYVTLTRGKEQVKIYAPERPDHTDKISYPPSQFIEEACIPGLPSTMKISSEDKVMKYVKQKAEEIKKDQPGVDKAQAFAIAWSIYCKYKQKTMPDTEGHCKRDPSEYFTGD